MGLFSDMDWLIILIVGGVLLLGGNNKELLRTAGRIYGRVMHLREELLKDVNQSLKDEPSPVPAPMQPGVWPVGTARQVPSLPAEQVFASTSQLTSVSTDGIAGNPGVGR